jgi:hypothetical protein
MSNTTKVAMAAMAAGLALSLVQPAEAGNGLSKKQVQKIIRQEVAKALRAGPPGPPGMDGAEGPMFLFAHIFPDPSPSQEPQVDEANSSGITQDNLRFEEFQDPLQERTVSSYCFTGLPPVRGGQVTTGVGDTFVPGFLTVNPESESCGVRVFVNQSPGAIPGSDFFVLLYR